MLIISHCELRISHDARMMLGLRNKENAQYEMRNAQ